jgi:hypothetical protein
MLNYVQLLQQNKLSTEFQEIILELPKNLQNIRKISAWFSGQFWVDI